MPKPNTFKNYNKDPIGIKKCNSTNSIAEEQKNGISETKSNCKKQVSATLYHGHQTHCN